MSDKIQMTEEQAREIVSIIEQDYDVVYIDLGVEKLKQAGYIKKSELQQKVEEAEELLLLKGSYADGLDSLNRIRLLREIAGKCEEAIQLLKQSHPEFKK